MLVTEPTPHLVDIVRAAVDGGVDIVQWRDKSLGTSEADDVEWIGLARQMRSAVRPPSRLIVNSSFELGLLANCDGFHLPESGPWNNWRVVRSEWAWKDRPETLVGYSVHSVDAARRAEEAGADYVVAGNIFETGSHPGKPAAGLDFLADICRAVSMPVLAIGGITPSNSPDCLRAGAAGIAVLSTIMRAVDPRAAAQAYRSALDNASLPL